MDRRATIQYRARVSDGAGGWTEDWQDWGERWVEYTPLGRRERLQAMAENLEVVGRVRLRWEPDMPSPMRLVSGALRLEQVGGQAVVDDARTYIEIDVVDSQADVTVTS